MKLLLIIVVWLAASIIVSLIVGRLLKGAQAAQSILPVIKTLAWTCDGDGCTNVIGYFLYWNNGSGRMARMKLDDVYLGQTQVNVILFDPMQFYCVSAFDANGNESDVSGLLSLNAQGQTCANNDGQWICQ